MPSTGLWRYGGISTKPSDAVQLLRRAHLRQRVEPHARVAELARAHDRSLGERAAEPGPARERANVEPLHLADRRLERADADAASRVVAEARDEHRVVAGRQRRELLLEALEREIDAERVGVLAEQRADEIDVVRVGDQRSARSAATSSGVGSHSPAFTFA